MYRDRHCPTCGEFFSSLNIPDQIKEIFSSCPLCGKEVCLRCRDNHECKEEEEDGLV